MRSQPWLRLLCLLLVILVLSGCEDLDCGVTTSTEPSYYENIADDIAQSRLTAISEFKREAPGLTQEEFAKRKAALIADNRKMKQEMSDNLLAASNALYPNRNVEKDGPGPATDQLRKKQIANEKYAEEQLNSVEAPAPQPADSTESGTSDPDVALYEEPPTGKPVQIFKIGNDLAVSNGGASPAVTFDRDYYLTEITTYHWNGGSGSAAGTISLAGSDGKKLGPWKATASNRVYWVAKPSVTVPAGTYKILDSNPSTWAQNADSGGKGMAWASGIPTK